MKEMLKRWPFLAIAVVAVLLGVPQLVRAASLTVLTVPEDPANPSTPHTTYPAKSITLEATVPSAVGSSDTFSVVWSFGDGSPNTTFTLSNPYDISTPHTYVGGAGQTWTATVTVTDTNNSNTGSATYFVIMEANTLASRVNVAIDNGLWYMHQTMWRQNSPANGQTVNWGGWDTQSLACPTVGGQSYDCFYYASIDASNIQAFEVSGHSATGPATDPYTDDIARGLARTTYFIASQANATVTYEYDPSKASYTCKDGSIPTTGDPTCSSHGGQFFYNAGATSCTAPNCVVTYDGNADGKMAYSNDASGEPIYTSAPFLDALVASGTPSATAQTGAFVGTTYKNIVQDILDYYGYSQYYYDCDVAEGYTRGNGSSCAGGAWLYSPQEGDDNSTSQWAAIAFISGERGLGINIPPAIKDFNNVWVTNSQDVGDPVPTGSNPWGSGKNYGAYGYRGSQQYSPEWGPFAVTPSGMVQMALDGIGRTKNSAFGDGSTDFDQRWNATESYYADNFCNNTSSGAYYAPRVYLYGLFSFTKSMLLHDPNGTLTPIQYLRTTTPNVFTTNTSIPPNSIDWYAALSPANGGTDPCDGVAQTLVSLQNPDGHWYGNSYYGYQWYYETAWSIIMLQKTVFVSCISNLYGRGTPGSGRSAARIDLSWGAQTGATSYDVLRGTADGGPYTKIGNTVTPVFSDRTGLTNGSTYYYVVQPLNGTSDICQSNQEPVTIPIR